VSGLPALLSFVRFSYQFSSVICAFSSENIFINLLYNFCHDSAKQSEKAGWQLCSRLWAWNELLLNTHISMYARTNRRYNKRDSRTNYVRSSTPHCTRKHADSESSYITTEIQIPVGNKHLKVHSYLSIYHLALSAPTDKALISCKTELSKHAASGIPRTCLPDNLRTLFFSIYE